MRMYWVLSVSFALLMTATPLALAQSNTAVPATASTTGAPHHTATKHHTTTKHHKATKHTAAAAAKPKTRTVCEDVVVQDTPKDNNQIAGMAIGAVAGGLLGNQVGGGKGRTLATVAGAVGGGYAGKKVQEHQQAKNTHTERRCHEVTD